MRIEMLTKLVTLSLALVFVATAHLAYAFVDPPTLDPPHPLAGQETSVDIYAGVCDMFTSDPPVITRTGNNIRMVLQAISAPPSSDYCFYPILTYEFSLGSLESGDYSLQVDREYMSFTGPIVTQTLGVLSFTISNPQVSVPVLGRTGIVGLVLVLLLAAAVALRRRIRLGLMSLAITFAFSPRVHAQQPQPDAPQDRTLSILLSTKSSSPTPEQVIAYINGDRKSNPPFQALSVQSPLRAGYLMPIRAGGDFSQYLVQHPDLPRAKLERYLLVIYPQGADLGKATVALRNESSVEAVYPALPGLRFSSAQLTGFNVTTNGAYPVSGGPQYGRDDLNVDAAWQIAGGYALVGVVDSGLYTAHPAVIPFAPIGTYLGGNFVPAASYNLGFAGKEGQPIDWSDTDVDEMYPLPVSPTSSDCNPNHLTAVPPNAAGHGTHVAGLIAANQNGGYALKGTCLHCGIAMWKVDYPTCNTRNQVVYRALNGNAITAAIGKLADTGAQVINMSLGSTDLPGNFCSSQPNDPFCLAIVHASTRDVAIVAAAGNDRDSIAFPANDARVVDVGGFDESLALWDLSPPISNYANCPFPPDVRTVGDECGSNYTLAAGDPKQELMASASQVLSLTYPNINWNNIGCGDGYPGPGWGNGKGLCTGTSMSAPQIAGIVGILRSINPLVHTGVPVPGVGQPVGIRTVLANSTYEAQAGASWSQTFGYGHPDAAAAAREMLGMVAGRRVLNRVTPLFHLYANAETDYADTTSPQFATALMVDQDANYVPQGQTTPGYASFPPNLAGMPALPAPRATVYVLTTEYTPWPNYPSLIPLYLLDCLPGSGDPGFPACTKTHRDFMLASTITDLQQAHQGGYSLRATVGYIYQACSPNDCMPPGAQKLYRECNATSGDCATFLESERASFEASGYTSAYPVGSSKVLGYAYPNLDSDNDGLVDGMEYAIGSNPNRSNSDGNSATDGSAYPQAGVPVSDPCVGLGAVTFNCPAKDFIFANGFQ